MNIIQIRIPLSLDYFYPNAHKPTMATQEVNRLERDKIPLMFKTMNFKSFGN